MSSHTAPLFNKHLLITTDLNANAALNALPPSQDVPFYPHLFLLFFLNYYFMCVVFCLHVSV